MPDQDDNGAFCGTCGRMIPAPPGESEAFPCPSCGNDVRRGPPPSILSLDLPPPPSPPAEGGTPPAGPPKKPAAPPAPADLPAPRKKTRRRSVAEPTRAGGGAHRAWLVEVPRTPTMDLPKSCACCMEPATDNRVVSASAAVEGNAQTLSIHVPYCAACLRHHGRQPWRRLVGVLLFIGLTILLAAFLPAPPDSFPSLLGLLAAVLVASGALAHLVVPRPALGPRHAREGDAAWIRRFDARRVTFVVCHEEYRDLLSAPDARAANARRKRQGFRWLSGLLYGSAAELARSPAFTLLRPAATLGLAALTLWLLVPLAPDEKAFRQFRAAPSIAKACDFVSAHRASRRLNEVEDYLWNQAASSVDLFSYRTYLRLFPSGRRRAEAEKAIEELAFAALRRNPTAAAAAQFIREFPRSPNVAPARELLVLSLEGASSAPEHAPPPAILRRIFQSAPSGKVKVKVVGFDGPDYKDEVTKRLRQALSTLGLAPEFTDGEAVIVVEGSNGLDKTFSYSKFAFGGAGPYSEFARAAVRVQFAPGEDPAWSTEIRASSPPTIKYTVHSFGGAPAFDMGPGQGHVHNQTVPVFAEALKRLFEYR